jgi:hypothetical protein
MKQDARKGEVCRPCKAEEKYKRKRDLLCLIGLWPHEIDDISAAGTQRIIAKLRSALRAGRIRGLAGHWSYDLDRHLGLVKACKNEMTALEVMTNTKQG